MDSKQIIGPLQNYLESLGALLVERTSESKLYSFTGNVFGELIEINKVISNAVEMSEAESSGDKRKDWTGEGFETEDYGSQREYEFLTGEGGDYGEEDPIGGLTVLERPYGADDDGDNDGIISGVSGDVELPAFFSESFLRKLYTATETLSSAASYAETQDWAVFVDRLLGDIDSVEKSWALYTGPNSTFADQVVLVTVQRLIDEENLSQIRGIIGGFLNADKMLRESKSLSGTLDRALKGKKGLVDLALQAEDGSLDLAAYFGEKAFAPTPKGLDDYDKERGSREKIKILEEDEEEGEETKPLSYDEIFAKIKTAGEIEGSIRLFDKVTRDDKRIYKGYTGRKRERSYNYVDLSKVAGGKVEPGFARVKSIENCATRMGYFRHDKKYLFSNALEEALKDSDKSPLDFSRSIFSDQNDADRLG